MKIEYLSCNCNLFSYPSALGLFKKWRLKEISENHLQGMATDIKFNPDINETHIRVLMESVFNKNVSAYSVLVQREMEFSLS